MGVSDEVERMLADARRRLEGVPREALGVHHEPRRVLGLSRMPRIVPAGRAWHLGVLLLADDGVLATGEVLRAREEAPRGYTAQSQRERAALAEAAFRGGFATGALVHVGWRPIDLAALDDLGAAGPLAVAAGSPVIRWSRVADPAPLEAYLDERIALLAQAPAAG